METYNNLSLRIYCGAVGTDLDHQLCVEVGAIPKAFSATAPVFVNEREAWMITHAQDYTLYTISYQGFHTIDLQPGHLLICLFVPAQKRLADGHSPLEVLEALKDTFVVQALCGDKLPQSPVDAAPYKALLDKYRLEERSLLLPVMQGKTPASFCVESKKQLDALMRHSRYPALISVGRLELGFSCPTGIDLVGKGTSCQSPNVKQSEVEIPLPKYPSQPEPQKALRENPSNECRMQNASKQKSVQTVRKSLIEKKWRWYYWTFFPSLYLLDMKKSQQKKVLLSYLLHPVLMLPCLIFLLGLMLGKDNNLIECLILCNGLFIGVSSLLIIPATKNFTNTYNISSIRMIFLTVIYALSLGNLFIFSTTIGLVLSLIAWFFYKIDKSLNVDKTIKLCFNIWYALQVLCFVLGGLLILFIAWLLLNFDFS